MNRRGFLGTLLAAIAAPTAAKSEWTRRSGTRYLGQCKSADPVLLMFDDGVVEFDRSMGAAVYRLQGVTDLEVNR